MRGFTNPPPSRRLTLREWRDSIASIRNGNGNIYRVPLSELLRLGAGAVTKYLRWWYDFRYDLGMKVAISIPDQLFDSADRLARRLKVSRSRLYAAALADFLDRQQADRVTERLNEVYGARPEGLAADLRAAPRRTLEKTEW